MSCYFFATRLAIWVNKEREFQILVDGRSRFINLIKGHANSKKTRFLLKMPKAKIGFSVGVISILDPLGFDRVEILI